MGARTNAADDTPRGARRAKGVSANRPRCRTCRVGTERLGGAKARKSESFGQAGNGTDAFHAKPSRGLRVPGRVVGGERLELPTPSV